MSAGARIGDVAHAHAHADGDGDADADGDATSLVGMAVLLGAWVMLFAALFLAYGVLRVQANEWPPFGAPRLPRVAPAFGTLLLLASSLALRRGLARVRHDVPHDARRDPRRALVSALRVAALLGVGFLAAQLAIGRSVLARGLLPSSGAYGSVFFAFTAFHALHVLGGVIALAVLAIRAGRAARAGRRAPVRAARLTALYWDFIGIVWVLMYLSIYWL